MAYCWYKIGNRLCTHYFTASSIGLRVILNFSSRFPSAVWLCYVALYDRCLTVFFSLSSYVTGNRLLLILRVPDLTVFSASTPTLLGTECCLYHVFEIQLFLRHQLLRYREQTVAGIVWSKFNCFFGLSSYVTGSRLLLILRVPNLTVSSASSPTLLGTECCLYHVFEIQLFLRPQLLRYREQTVAGIMWSKFNCFFGLSSYVTGSRQLLVLLVWNATVSSASVPTLQGTGCCLYYVFKI